MWKAIVWVEGENVDFTSNKETEDDAVDDILEQAIEFCHENHEDVDTDGAMFFFEALERV